MKWLVMGFGPFGEFTDNPARRLALGVDGRGRATTIVGCEMPVSYGRSVEATLAAIARFGPDAVLGIGVAGGRNGAFLERVGRRAAHEVPDVDGVCAVLEGPERRWSTLADDLAGLLGCSVSDDAGSYVCNGWLYAMLARTDLPLGFLHIPPEGMEVARLAEALEALGQV